MGGKQNNVISFDHYKTLKYPEKLRLEAQDSPTRSLTLEQYTAGIAAMAEPGMSAGDAIMHFFWTIADNTEDTADSLMTQHAEQHKFYNKNTFMTVIRPMVHTQMLMLQGKVMKSIANQNAHAPHSPSDH